MEENLIGYLLQALDPEAEREVETYLREHSESPRQLEKLRQALKPLESDRDTIEPPRGLAARTLSRLGAVRERASSVPPAPPVLRAAPAVHSWWRRPDVLVAAVLVILAAGVASPALFRARAMQDRLHCSNNMRDLHQALVDYSQITNGAFPHADDRPRHNVAGVYVPILHEQGVLRPRFSTRCPARNEPSLTPLTTRELEAMSQEEFDRIAPQLSGCYAYTLGYRDEAGKLRGLRPDDGDDLPIVADRPLTREENNACEGLRDNSPNHRGQNVLYIGGHVRFHRSPECGRAHDHIFVNRKGDVKAGADRDDSVLGLSGDRP
jgi:hypothetical protein